MSEENTQAAPLVDADDALNAARAIEALANQFRHMVKAAETLKTVGVAANTLRELEAAIALARTTKAEADEQVDLVRQMLAELRAQADGILAEARQQGDEVLAQARERAEKIVADARAHAAEVAQEGAEQRQAAIDKAHATLSELGEQIAGARNDLETLTGLRSNKAAEVDALEARLQSARAAAAQILTPPQ